MKKIIILIVLVFIGILTGGIYGVIHDQFTYTISSEYYTNYKFIKFNMGEKRGRLGAGVVGFFETMWASSFLSVALGLLGFIHKSCLLMLKYTTEAYIIIILVLCINDLICLISGFISYHFKKTEYSWKGRLFGNVIHLRSFFTVGIMHYYSFIGVCLGLITAVLWQFIRRFS